MKQLFLAHFVLSLLGIGLLEARQAEDPVIAFNDHLVERLKASQAPFEAFWASLAPWYAGEVLERPLVNKTFEEVRKTHQRVYAELLEMEVPDQELCRDFYDAVIDYLTIDREILAAYDVVLKYVFANNPATKRRDITHVNGVVDPVLARQEAVLERIAKLQESMAQTHGFALRGINRITVVAAEKE